MAAVSKSHNHFKKSITLIYMCFSASASFIAGAGLTSISAVTVRKVEEKKELPFALIPLFFGIQQLAEGFVWLTLQGQFENCNLFATNFFAFFAYAFWPMYIPFAVIAMETISSRKIWQYLTLGAGLIVGLHLLFSMLIEPYTSSIFNQSIVYIKEYSHISLLVSLYLIGTVISFFLSSHRFVQLFGLTMAISATFSYIYYSYAFASTWCFFAAVLSVSICAYFYKKPSHKNGKDSTVVIA